MPSEPKEPAAFLSTGGAVQERYERLRAYALLEPARRPQVSPAQFDWQRFDRFGLLGLVDGTCVPREAADFSIYLVPVGAADAEERLVQLYEVLTRLVTEPRGGADGTGGTVREGLDGPAREGTDDPEPARRHHALRG